MLRGNAPMRAADGRPTNMLSPNSYAAATVTELLREAAHGRIGIDQRWVRAIVGRGGEAVPELVRYGLEAPADAPVDLEDDIIAMLRHLRDPRSLDYFVEVIRRHPDELSDDLNLAVPEFQERAVEPLLKVYGELEEDMAGEVAFLLAALGSRGVRDARILQVLLDRLEYDMREGALCLGLYGDPAALPALEKLLAEEPEDGDLQFAIRELKDSDPAPVPEEEWEIWSAYPEVRSPDFSVMSEPERLALLKSGPEEDRAAAAYSFFNEAASEEAFATLLEAAREDESPRVRGRAWEAVGSLTDQLVIDGELASRAKDPQVPLEERLGALVGWASRDGGKDFDRTAKELYQIPEGRAKALEAMWRSLDRSYADYFIRHLEDPDSEVQRMAIRGVGYCQVRGEVNHLKEFFEDEDVREDALFAYAMAAPADPTPSRMRALFNKIDAEASLSDDERELVALALDERMLLAGKERVFFTDDDEESE